MSRTEADLREFYAELPVSEDAERRLQQWISQSATSVTKHRPAGSRIRRPRRLAVMAAVAVVAVVGAVAGVLTWRTHASQPRPPAVTSATETFLTVSYPRPGIGMALQLRRVSDGSLVNTVLRTAPNSRVEATRAADGQLLVALITGCTTRLERLDPTTGRTTPIRTLGEPVDGMAVSPNSEQLAYLTQTRCIPTSCPSSSVCHGLAQPPPSVVVVLDLHSGRSVRAATANYRHDLTGLSWSPDAHHVVVGFAGNVRKIAGYAGPEYELVILDAADPNFRTARDVPNQPRCSYFAPSWTKTGIVASEGCAPDPGLSQDRLVRIDTTGAISAHWPLPACSSAGNTRTDPTHDDVLVEIRVGYGNGSCGKNWATRITRINGSSLHTVMNLPGASVGIGLDG